jgi:hypothetical protein
MEPTNFPERVKWHLLARMIPLVENNYNLVELGPRGTGKSHIYKEISPNSILVSGGQTTVANLFYNMARRQVGLVGLWDVVAFDEVPWRQLLCDRRGATTAASCAPTLLSRFRRAPSVRADDEHCTRRAAHLLSWKVVHASGCFAAVEKPFENQGFLKYARRVLAADSGTKRHQSAPSGTESPEKFPKCVLQAFTVQAAAAESTDTLADNTEPVE